VGAALYEAGGTDRSLAPISAQLVSYLQSARATDGGTGSPGLTRESGCATAGAGYALLAVLPLLWVFRRRRAPGGPPTA
jgi:Synergist-CTERM protein sorting domain-containing protein